MIPTPKLAMTVIAAIVIWVSLPFFVERSSASVPLACSSGQFEARLTGWVLNNKTPKGEATYDDTTKQLNVSIESVALPDGRTLDVLIGDRRIGQIAGLKDGTAKGTVTQDLSEGDRVRIFDAERPIVSGNL